MSFKTRMEVGANKTRECAGRGGVGRGAYRVVVAVDDRFIEACSLRVLVLLHEQHVSHVQFPRLIVAAVVHRATEQVLQLAVVRSLPQHLRLMHQHRHIPTHTHTHTDYTHRSVNTSVNSLRLGLKLRPYGTISYY